MLWTTKQRRNFSKVATSRMRFHCGAIATCFAAAVAFLSDRSVADTINPELVGSYTRGTTWWGGHSPWGIAYSEKMGMVYVTLRNTDGLLIVDVADPTNPNFVVNWANSVRLDKPTGIAYDEARDVVYVAASGSGVAIFDVRDPKERNIERLASYSLAGAWGIVYDSLLDYVYVTNWYGHTFTVLDVSDTENPSYVGSHTDETFLGGAAVIAYDNEQYAYVAAYRTSCMTVMDVGTDPTNPTRVGSFCNYIVMRGAHGIAYSDSDKLVMVTGKFSNALTILDVSNPTDPSWVGWYQSATHLDGASNVAYNEVVGYAYVTSCNSDSMTIIDVGSNPGRPSFVGTYSSSTIDGAWGLTLDPPRGLVYTVGANSNAVAVIDVTKTPAPTISHTPSSAPSVSSVPTYSPTRVPTELPTLVPTDLRKSSRRGSKTENSALEVWEVCLIILGSICACAVCMCMIGTTCDTSADASQSEASGTRSRRNADTHRHRDVELASDGRQGSGRSSRPTNAHTHHTRTPAHEMPPRDSRARASRAAFHAKPPRHRATPDEIGRLPTAVLTEKALERLRGQSRAEAEGNAPPGARREEECCAVCYEPWAAGDEVRTLPCLHRLHTACIDPWLRQNATCPVCKTPAVV